MSEENINLAFLDSIISNIYDNYLEVTAITSRTRGKIRSVQRPFGVGKSTLAFELSYLLHYISEYGLESISSMEHKDMKIWYLVFDHAVYSLDGVVELITYADERIPCIVWDDAQLTAPAVTHISQKLREKIMYISAARLKLANLILTAPSISELAKPLRKLVSYELIVPFRGKYEIQKYTRRKNFYRPTDDYERLIYFGDGSFPPLPPEVQEMYDKWRENQMKMFGLKQLISEKVALR